MPVKKYIALSRVTNLKENIAYCNFDGYIFGDSYARDNFLAINGTEAEAISFLPNQVSETYDLFINSERNYIEFLLPQVLDVCSINSITVYDGNSTDTTIVRLDKKEIMCLLVGGIVKKYAKKMEFGLVPTYTNDKLSSFAKIDFNHFDTGSKTWLFILPGGCSTKFDFSVYKIIGELKKYGIKTVLLSLINCTVDVDELYFDEILQFNSLSQLVTKICEIEHEKIFYRGWMTEYSLGAFLSNNFSNVVVYLKDCFFSDPKIYKLLFGVGEEEFEALIEIFRNASVVASHYGDGQGAIWAKRYGVSHDKFLFLPEICEEERWLYPSRVYKDISIVHAGSLPPTSIPQEFFPTKPFFDDIKRITKKTDELFFACVVAEKVYDGIFGDTAFAYKDWLYEDLVNDQFSIVKGKDMDPKVIEKYQWGVFELSDHTSMEELIKFAIPSKFAFYLEAGLPIIVNKKISMLANIAEEFGIGLVFDNEEVIDLDERLKMSQEQYDGFVRRTVEYREKYHKNTSSAVAKLLNA